MELLLLAVSVLLFAITFLVFIISIHRLVTISHERKEHAIALEHDEKEREMHDIEARERHVNELLDILGTRVDLMHSWGISVEEFKDKNPGNEDLVMSSITALTKDTIDYLADEHGIVLLVQAE